MSSLTLTEYNRGGGGKELSAALIIDHFQAEKSPLFLDSNQLVYETLIHGIKSVLFDVVTPPCVFTLPPVSASRVTHAHNDRATIQLLADLLRFPPFYLLTITRVLKADKPFR